MTPDVKRTKSTTSKKRKQKKEGAKSKLVKIKCPICFENFGKQSVSSTICGHVFCTNCLQKSILIRPACPTCRRSLRGSKTHHLLYLDHCVYEEWQ
ncbi:unnamed protein product [Leptidea sinapis]|uniref:RING-type domain-containing protein n=1 Tax=Leptidea sinapis TaxID=189913 RepID=A0A5E4PWU4_9NEOP|nr:unnamed protein product [Leptidea sinapis]